MELYKTFDHCRYCGGAAQKMASSQRDRPAPSRERYLTSDDLCLTPKPEQTLEAPRHLAPGARTRRFASVAFQSPLLDRRLISVQASLRFCVSIHDFVGGSQYGGWDDDAE